MIIKGPLVIDVSRWDDHLNIQELVDGGVVSVIVGLYQKAGGLLNDNCKRICDQVSKSNLILQVYQYVYPQFDVYAQADWFAQTIHTTGYPIKFAWADCEIGGGLSPELVSERFRIFTERLNTRYPGWVGVYTNTAFIKEFGLPMRKWLPAYPAWIPQYRYRPAQRTMMTWTELKIYWLPNYDIDIDPSQTHVVGHQFTGDRCLLPGVYNYYDFVPWWPNKGREALDVSVFTVDFLKSLGANIPPTPPPPVPEVLDYVVNVGAINVRSGPSLAATKVTIIWQGTVVHLKSTTTTNGYVQMTDGNWVFFQYLTKKV